MIMKDPAKAKINQNIPGMKTRPKGKPAGATAAQVGVKRAPVRTPLPLPKGKNISAVAGKNKLLKAAVVVGLLLLIFAVWFGNRPEQVPESAPADKKVAERAQTPEQTLAEGAAANKPLTPDVKKDAAPQVGPIVSAVRITPSQPLPGEPIKAEPVLKGGGAEGVDFSYRWKINDQFIDAEDTAVLSGVTLKRRDRISVVVTATKDGITGPETQSHTVVIHGPPPALALKIITDSLRPGEPVELQLLGKAPDEDRVVYSLVPPFLEGMTLDDNTGKILWKPERILPGRLQFGASCADSDGNKTVRVFALDFGVSFAK